MKQNHQNDILLEVIATLLCIGYLIFTMRSTLFFGTTTLTHDNLYWDLPIFHYFAEGIRNRALPLWNPYSHGGEPLLPAYLQLRMLDPTSFITAWFGQYFTNDLITLFAWDRLIKALIGAIGVYLLLRQWTSSRLVKYSLIPIVFWSSLTLSSLNQNGILDEFYCAPYLAFFVFRILYARDYRLQNWVGSGLSFGVCLQSYFFAGSVILVTFILFGFAVTRRADLSALIRDRRNFSGATLAAVMILAMSGPLLFMFLTKGDFSFVARGLPEGWESMSPNGGPFGYDLGPQENVPDSLIMPYKMIYYSGTFAYVVDFAGLLVPPFRYLEGYNSDSIQFLGSLVLLGAVIGAVSGRHPLKQVWGIIGVSFGLLILGAYGGLHWLLYKIYPPLWFIRHTHLLVNFFLMAVLFFYVLGAEFILQRLGGSVRLAAAKSSWLTQWIGNPQIARVSAQLVVYFSTIWFSAEAVSWQPEVVGDISPIPFMLTALTIIFWLFRSTLDAQHVVSAIIFGLITMALIKSGQQINIFIYLLYSLGIPVLLVLVSERYRGYPSGHATVISRAITESHPDVFPDKLLARTIPEVTSRLLFVTLLMFVCIILLRLFFHYGHSLSGVLFLFSLASLVFSLVTNDKVYLTRNVAHRVHEAIFRIVLIGISISLLLPFAASPNMIDGFEPDLHFAGIVVWSELILSTFVMVLRPQLVFVFVEKFNSSDHYSQAIFRLLFIFLLPWALVTLYFLVFGHPRHTVGVLIAMLFFLYSAVAIFWPRLMSIVYDVTVRILKIFGGWRATVPYIVVLFMLFDLSSYVDMAFSMWKMPRPDTYLSVPNATSMPRLPDTRVPITQIMDGAEKNTRGLEQPIRYSELLTRQIAALDFPRTFPEYPFRDTTFYEVLKSHRWNSFTEPLMYSRLIHSNLDPAVLQMVFTVGQPLLQYRPYALQSNDFIKFMGSLDPQQALDVLAQNVIISGTPVTASFATKRAPSAIISAAEVRESGYNYNSVNFDVRTPADGYLYYADGYDRYWRAFVDGREVPVYRANMNFKAIAVDSAVRQVRFVYDPELLRWAILLFESIFAAGLIYLVIVSFRRAPNNS